jgi:probable phosphoglycerate mutase
MSQLILIRHGETEWNRERRMQGHADSPLSEKGLRQAILLAQRMKKIEFKAFYSSDSGRAAETARFITDATGRPVLLEPRLRERNFGVFEGLTGPEMQERHPEAYARFKNREPDYVVPGGESARAFRDRALACLAEIATRHENELVVVVTHGLVCDVAYRAAYGLDLMAPRNFELVNAGINRFRFDGAAWHCEVWGDAGHLEAGLQSST